MFGLRGRADLANTAPMSRRRAPPPLPPELAQRDTQDLAVCEKLITILAGLEKAALLDGLSINTLGPWLQRRTVAFCSMRGVGLMDDDGAPAVK